ncbi:MAG: CBS domain-containing protein [Verrucomicrobia bacterium]|jgi:CBS domain-containing protein|nr:CBS domain-containing protein [Verrucomicrobiota bacterium]
MIPNAPVSELIRSKGGTVWTVTPETMVFDAIQMMAEKNIGALVVAEGGRMVGLMSERDYTRKVVLKGKSSKTTPVREILSEKVVSVTPETTVQECLQLMTQSRIRHLPVMRNHDLLGIVSIGDLVNWVIQAQSSTIQQLETYISGYPTEG